MLRSIDTRGMALRKIYGKNRRKVQVGIMVGKQVSREELYEQVWKTPADKLAKDYSLSGCGLGKICARLNIPVPGMGYWRKLETGHAPEPPLPPAIDESQRHFSQG